MLRSKQLLELHQTLFPHPIYGKKQSGYARLDRLSNGYSSEINYSIEEQEAYVHCNEPLLTADQRDVYNYFCDLIEREEGGIVFLDAPGGTGKTFLLNLILAKRRSQSKIALATASSGIAATLLVGGQTLHSTFKIPLEQTYLYVTLRRELHYAHLFEIVRQLL